MRMFHNGDNLQRRVPSFSYVGKIHLEIMNLKSKDKERKTSERESQGCNPE